VDAARDQLAAAGCSVLVVCQAKPEVLARYLARQKWTAPVVSDPDRAAYRAFGLERTGWLTFFRPKVLWGYLRGMLRGYGLKTPYAGEDVLQLGGDFVLDRAGTVVFADPSADPTDRPTVAQILDAIRSAAPDGPGDPSL
jgi:peroxiredoxin